MTDDTNLESGDVKTWESTCYSLCVMCSLYWINSSCELGSDKSGSSSQYALYLITMFVYAVCCHKFYPHIGHILKTRSLKFIVLDSSKWSVLLASIKRAIEQIKIVNPPQKNPLLFLHVALSGLQQDLPCWERLLSPKYKRDRGLPSHPLPPEAWQRGWVLRYCSGRSEVSSISTSESFAQIVWILSFNYPLCLFPFQNRSCR